MNRIATNVFSVLSLIGSLTLASLIVLGAVLYFTGVITPQKASDMVKVLSGELVGPVHDAAAGDEGYDEPLQLTSEEQLKQAVERWRTQRAAQEERLREKERAIEAMLRELVAVEGSIDNRQRQLEDSIAAFEAQRQARLAAQRDEGFARAVDHYRRMDARDVAELLYELPDQKVVAYLEAFTTGFAADILTEIKRVDEQHGVPGLINRAALLQELMKGEEVAFVEQAAAAEAGR